MKSNIKPFLAIIFVAVILLSGFALTPLLAVADKVPFSWENYAGAYQIFEKIFLPLVIK